MIQAASVRKKSFILRSLEKHQKNEFFNRWILSVEIKDCFYFKMTAQDQRTLKLIWEMVELLTVCTLGILGLILKNYYFDND